MTQATTKPPRAADAPPELPVQMRAAQLVPSTWNEADRTIEVVWTVGSRRRAYDYWNDTVYEEELVVSPEAVDMTRFDAGVVQVLDSHRTYGGLDAILGIAERAWIANGEGRALLRFSQRDEVAGLVGDIKAGVIRAISFGYSVDRYEITRAQDRTDGGKYPLYRAVRWTPQEISFVTVPADPKASTRSQQGNEQDSRRLPCEFVIRADAPQSEIHMDEKDKGGAAQAGVRNDDQAAIAAQQAAQAAADKVRAEAVAAEQKRSADITDLCARHGLAQLAGELIRGNATVDAARAKVLDELAARSAAGGGHTNVTPRIETKTDAYETMVRGMVEAVHSRVDAGAELTDNGRQYRYLSITDMAGELLEAQGIKARGMSKHQKIAAALQLRTGAGAVVTRDAAFMTTGDFASILAAVANKRLRGGYEENPGTYRAWARRAPNAPDFKAMTVAQLGGAPDLLKVNEHGEFKYGAMSDGKETYALTTFGRIVGFSREAMVNDDLRAFDRLVTAFGNSAARLENRSAYAVLTSNPVMGDGTVLFHANHGNLGSGGGSALQFTSLVTMRTAMRKQKGLQAEELNISPAFLIGPAALEQTMYQLTSPNYTPATKAEINEFRAGGRTALAPIVEPVLDSDSATAWYAMANNGQVDTVEFCYLDGAEGPVMESKDGFEVDGMQLKCRLDFAVKAIDWRGIYKAAGV